jgi:O-antigen ligase
MVVGFGLHNGGFFPETIGIATIVVLAALLVRVTLDPGSFAEQPRAAGVGLVALALLGAWLLLSSTWSDAPSRAILEYGRLLLYAGLAALFMSVPRSEPRARAFAIALAVGCAVIGIAALGPWLLPNDFALNAAFRRDRLNWPTSYWNATGLMAAFGAVLCTHLVCSVRDHPVVRVLGAGAVPLLIGTLVFSGSRGAVVAGVVGIAVYLATGPSRGMLTGLPVAAAATAAAAVNATGVTGLDAAKPTAAALDAGHDAAVVMILIGVAAAVVRAALVLADRRLAAARLPVPDRRIAWSVGVGLLVVGAVVSIALGSPNRLSDAWDRFTDTQPVSSTEQAGDRFTQLGNNGRIDVWRVAWDDGVRSETLRGIGAGTYALLWQRGRPTTQYVVDAHSLELETLAELGVVGLVLLLVALVGLIGALWSRALRDRAPAWAALAAVATAWAVRSSVDWDWEMPVLTAWLFAAGGLALGNPVAAAAARRRTPSTVARTLGILGGVACLVLAVLPWNIIRSQDALIDAQRAVRVGDCGRAISSSLAATRALNSRPESFELLAWCDVRLGQAQLALAAADAAVRRDPGNWELRYTQALVRAVAGEDPRSAARAALRRNPLDERAQTLVRQLTLQDRSSWRRIALDAPLPLGS